MINIKIIFLHYDKQVTQCVHIGIPQVAIDFTMLGVTYNIVRV